MSPNAWRIFTIVVGIGVIIVGVRDVAKALKQKGS